MGDPAYEKYCGALAELLARAWPEARKANEEDIAAAEQRGLPPVLVERLRLTDDHLGQLVAMAAAVPGELRAATATATEQGTAVASPGAFWRRVPKPLGVALMIYEARPTVTVEGALLFAAAGNAVLLQAAARR